MKFSNTLYLALLAQALAMPLAAPQDEAGLALGARQLADESFPGDEGSNHKREASPEADPFLHKLKGGSSKGGGGKGGGKGGSVGVSINVSKGGSKGGGFSKGGGSKGGGHSKSKGKGKRSPDEPEADFEPEDGAEEAQE